MPRILCLERGITFSAPFKEVADARDSNFKLSSDEVLVIENDLKHSHESDFQDGQNLHKQGLFQSKTSKISSRYSHFYSHFGIF